MLIALPGERESCVTAKGMPVGETAIQSLSHFGAPALQQTILLLADLGVGPSTVDNSTIQCLSHSASVLWLADYAALKAGVPPASKSIFQSLSHAAATL